MYSQRDPYQPAHRRSSLCVWLRTAQRVMNNPDKPSCRRVTGVSCVLRDRVWADRCTQPQGREIAPSQDQHLSTDAVLNISGGRSADRLTETSHALVHEPQRAEHGERLDFTTTTNLAGREKNHKPSSGSGIEGQDSTVANLEESDSMRKHFRCLDKHSTLPAPTAIQIFCIYSMI